MESTFPNPLSKLVVDEEIKLKGKYKDLLRHLQATGDLGAGFSHVLSFYKNRPDYNIDFVRDCLEELEHSKRFIHRQNSFLVELNIWYGHISPKSQEESVKLALESWNSLNLPISIIEKATPLILALKHDSPQKDESAYACDIDLVRFGKSPEHFIMPKGFNVTYANLFRYLLDREHIYQTEYFRGRCENNARINLENLLNRLAS